MAFTLWADDAAAQTMVDVRVVESVPVDVNVIAPVQVDEVLGVVEVDGTVQIATPDLYQDTSREILDTPGGEAVAHLSFDLSNGDTVIAQNLIVSVRAVRDDRDPVRVSAIIQGRDQKGSFEHSLVLQPARNPFESGVDRFVSHNALTLYFEGSDLVDDINIRVQLLGSVSHDAQATLTGTLVPVGACRLPPCP